MSFVGSRRNFATPLARCYVGSTLAYIAALGAPAKAARGSVVTRALQRYPASRVKNAHLVAVFRDLGTIGEDVGVTSAVPRDGGRVDFRAHTLGCERAGRRESA